MHDTDGLEDEYGPIPEREVVLAEELKLLVEPILAQQEAAYKSRAEGQNHCPGGPLSLLAMHSGVPERSIFRILKGESVTVDLDLADRILMALDLNLTLDLPAGAIVPQREATNAVLEQTELLKAIARRRGDYVPPAGSKAMRTWAGPYRRKLEREAA